MESLSYLFLYASKMDVFFHPTSYIFLQHVCFTFYMARKEYVASLSLQRCEMRQMEADHQNQLEGISLELMHFESSLRTKENQIDTMLATKDQVPTF
jgi:hypothetical protein